MPAGAAASEVKLDDLLALLPDNTTGEISPADMRTIVTSLYNDANPSYANVVPGGTFNLAVHAAYTALTPAVVGSTSFDTPTEVQVIISANVDTLAANNAVQVALDLSGATVVAAGSKPEQVLWVGGKQQVQSTLEVTYLQSFAAGTTNLQVMYTAQAAATLTGLAVIVGVVSS
jgi:hypothetical protein